MPKEGIEPSRPCGRMILSHLRLPFRHFGAASFYHGRYSHATPSDSIPGFVVATQQVPDLGNSDWRAWHRGRCDHRVSAPMPYGPPSSAILCRFAQAPRESYPTGHRFADPVIDCRARPNPQLLKPQLDRVHRNRRPRPRGPEDGWLSAPMPYGPPFSDILCRSTQAPRKSCPTGHRFADPVIDCRARPNPQLRNPVPQGIGSRIQSSTAAYLREAVHRDRPCGNPNLLECV